MSVRPVQIQQRVQPAVKAAHLPYDVLIRELPTDTRRPRTGLVHTVLSWIWATAR